MKILKPGLDFKAAFRSYVEKRMNRMSANRDLDEEEKNKMISSIALGRKDMQHLLTDVGVLMKKNEVFLELKKKINTYFSLFQYICLSIYLSFFLSSIIFKLTLID